MQVRNYNHTNCMQSDSIFHQKICLMQCVLKHFLETEIR